MKYITINEAGEITGMYLEAPSGDCVELSDDDWARVGPGYRYIDGALVEPPPPAPPTLEVIVGALTVAIQDHMDAAARDRGYDDIKTAITYLGDPNPRFAREAQAFFTWRSAVWTQAYALLESVQAGKAALPSAAEAIAMLPAIDFINDAGSGDA